MAKLSTTAIALARLTGRKAGQNRTVQAAVNAGQVTAKQTGRVVRVLWLEITGLLFVAVALSCVGAAFREYHKYTSGQIGPGRYRLAIVFAIVFAWFGLTSFWRARRRVD